MGLRDQTDNLTKNICNLSLCVCMCVRFCEWVCSIIDCVTLAESGRVVLQVIHLVLCNIREQAALLNLKTKKNAWC